MGRDDTLAGKVALITGGAQGQGAAEGRLFTAAGATVVLADVADAEGKEMADEIGGRYLHLDVASEEEWDTVVADVMVTHGQLDVVVNNAGIFRSARPAHIGRTEPVRGANPLPGRGRPLRVLIPSASTTRRR